MSRPHGALFVIPLRPRRLALAGVLLVGLAALLLCRPGTTAALAPVPTDPSPELRLLTPDTIFFLHVRIGDLMSRPLVKQVLPLLPFEKDMTPDDIGLEGLGTKLSDIESFAFFGSEKMEIYAVTTRRPSDRDRVLQAVAPGARPHTIKGKTVHVSEANRNRFKDGAPPPRGFQPYAPAVYFLDGRTYLGGRASSVTEFLERVEKPDEKHRLHAALTRAGRHHLTAGVALPDDLRQVFRQEIMSDYYNPISQLAAAALRPLLDARHATVTADLADESRVDAAGQFTDARSAVKGRDATRFLLSMLKAGVDLLDEEAVEALGGPEKMRDARLSKFLDSVRQSLDDASVKADGNTVKLAVRLKTDEETAKAVLADTVPRLQVASQCVTAMHNLKQIGLAFHNYMDAYKTMPAAGIYSPDGKPLFSWRVALLPYLEQGALYNQLRLHEPWDSEHNKKVLAKAKMPKVFELPGVQAGENKTFLQVFTGKNTPFDGPRGPGVGNFPDGFSNTLLVVEAAEAVHWAAPGDIAYSPRVSPLRQVGRHYGKGTLAVRADGSVVTIAATATESDFRAAVTPAGGEVIGYSFFGGDERYGGGTGGGRKYKDKRYTSTGAPIRTGAFPAKTKTAP